MFSITTMLSSTRMPTDSVNASIENRFRFSPSRFISPLPRGWSSTIMWN